VRNRAISDFAHAVRTREWHSVRRGFVGVGNGAFSEADCFNTEFNVQHGR
jgi:hypothetical protein